MYSVVWLPPLTHQTIKGIGFWVYLPDSEGKYACVWLTPLTHQTTLEIGVCVDFLPYSEEKIPHIFPRTLSGNLKHMIDIVQMNEEQTSSYYEF